MLPERKNIISKELFNILEYFFDNLNETDFVLGGGYALTEFYFGHRNPKDIDLFFINKNDIDIFHGLLSQTYNNIKRIEERVGTSYVFRCENELDTDIHCVCIRDWVNIDCHNKYSTQFKNIKLQTPDYICFDKLDNVNVSGLPANEINRNILDLYYANRNGIGARQLLSVAISVGKDLDNWPIARPYSVDEFEVDIIKDICIDQIDFEDLRQFINDFSEEVNKVLLEENMF